MFQKVLIAEDYQGDNKSIFDTLKATLNIPEVQEESYCDKAFNRLKVAFTNQEEFDLLITDLSFKEDHVPQGLSSGVELIAMGRNLQPDLKVIVNSMEDNPVKIKALFDTYKINAYVCKGRHSLDELVKAVRAVAEGKTYLSPQIDFNTAKNVFELDELDLFILKNLAEGFSKKEIRYKLKQKDLRPNSESTIDKRVSSLFTEFGAKNSTELVAKLIREGLI
ncbi:MULTISPECIES: response regulator transcription factor [unclassified Leeuwenhoekiella]|uniref:response regulator transcription factor n=1 Tax=unclassified Leeuwenhoekiella TaxID=2615029 RepID=UPI000C531CFD|nr:MULTISPECIES: response regulator transcription factor [unclassified Leeuwenhoekiella]MAW96937.1 response regulator [Leeuwenhoekiella sp.]MBA80641.1 response regulator [Leeuwenhoekiella sp.]|tara:strand:+ start:3277 stop:3942 length:666 start_codon:yes stop_codon:yes gene_type:complete